jgi:hypothetical protein
LYRDYLIRQVGHYFLFHLPYRQGHRRHLYLGYH